MKAFIVVVNLGVQTALQNIFVMTGNGKLCGGGRKAIFQWARKICYADLLGRNGDNMAYFQLLAINEQR